MTFPVFLDVRRSELLDSNAFDCQQGIASKVEVVVILSAVKHCGLREISALLLV